MTITEKNILRELAMEYAEAASNPIHETKRKLWKT